MKKSKIALAIALSAGLLAGCDFDVGPESGNNTGGDPEVPGDGGGLPPVEGAENFLQIQDSTVDDTGILRVKTSESKSGIAPDNIPAGFLTVDLTYQNNTAINGENAEANAYIQIHTTDGSSNAHLKGEIALGAGMVQYRNPVDAKLVDTGGTYTPGEELSVKVTWTEDSFSFTIGEDSYGPYAVASTSPVELVSLKVGDSKTKADYELIADNLKIYSSDDSGDELVFEDDFDQYGVGDDLTNSRYNRAIDLMVMGNGETDPEPDPTPDPDPTPGDVTDDFESYTAGTLISDASSDWKTYNILDDEFGTTTAEVSIAKSNGGTQSLFLEDKNTDNKPFATREFAAVSSAGSVSIDAYFPSTNTKSTYINVGVGKNNSDRYFELNQSGTQLKYENGASDVKIADIVQDQWYTVTLAWTAEGKVTVSLDGQVIASDIDQASTGLAAENIPSQITLYTGDNSSDVNTAYFDNLDSDLF